MNCFLLFFFFDIIGRLVFLEKSAYGVYRDGWIPATLKFHFFCLRACIYVCSWYGIPRREYIVDLLRRTIEPIKKSVVHGLAYTRLGSLLRNL
jgi:hypothetical protein